MNSEAELYMLKLFNEKADVLQSRHFTGSLKGSGCKILLEQGGDLKIKRRGPNEEEIAAFILTYRFFTLDQDGMSFSKIKKIYDRLPVSPEKKELFNSLRNELNGFLDSPSIVQVGKELTYRHIQQIIIYGGLAHANIEKKKILDQWMGLPFNMMELIWNEFIYSLGEVEKIICNIKDLNDQVIAELQK